MSSFISFLSRLAKRERFIFYITVIFVGIMLLDRLMLSPILAKMSELDEEILLQEEDIERSLLILTQEKRIADESNEYDAYFSKPESEEKDVTAFLKEIENLAKESTVYLVDIKPTGQKVKGRASKQYFLKADFEAQMEQVFSFFYAISRSKKLLRIEGYQIRPKSEGSSIVTCSMSISKTIVPK